jgi:hypothetical protein
MLCLGPVLVHLPGAHLPGAPAKSVRCPRGCRRARGVSTGPPPSPHARGHGSGLVPRFMRGFSKRGPRGPAFFRGGRRACRADRERRPAGEGRSDQKHPMVIYITDTHDPIRQHSIPTRSMTAFDKGFTTPRQLCQSSGRRTLGNAADPLPQGSCLRSSSD